MNHKTALITGASSGIGLEFARQLASQGYDLVLVARREDRLSRLAADLIEKYHVYAEFLVADLSQLEDVKRVEQRIEELSTLFLLVNNAGFGVPGKFIEIPLERSLEMIHVHVIASVRLSRAAIPGMVALGNGGLIHVASIGALIPRPEDGTYCATKAYLVAFSQALQGELAGTGVQVQALCPGFVPTEFLDRPDYERLQVKNKIPKWLWTPAEVIVKDSLKAFGSGQVIYIPGFKNRFIVALARSGLSGVLLKILASSVGRPNQNLIPQSSLRRKNPGGKLR